MKPLAFALLLLVAALASAGQPQPHLLSVSIDPYPIPVGGSNAVITVYKSVWLGTVATPWKPTAIFPATRTNTVITVLPGTYFFRATATVQPYGESAPSLTVTNRVQ